MRRSLCLAIALVFCAPVVLAQKTKPLSASELAAISARGRLLAGYDAVSRTAATAVMALHPSPDGVAKHIAKNTNAGWIVAFGKLSEARDAFWISCEAAQGNGPDQATVKAFDPPQKDTGFFFLGEKAIELALQHSQLENRPYDTYVLPLDSGQMYVYVLPAQTEENIYPLGGDARFLISADASTILETRPLHKVILEVNHAAQAETKTVSGFHTHVLTDVPEDTDVFYVMRQADPLPEYVGTKSGVYLIQIDGTIKHMK